MFFSLFYIVVSKTTHGNYDYFLSALSINQLMECDFRYPWYTLIAGPLQNHGDGRIQLVSLKIRHILQAHHVSDHVKHLQHSELLVNMLSAGLCATAAHFVLLVINCSHTHSQSQPRSLSSTLGSSDCSSVSPRNITAAI